MPESTGGLRMEGFTILKAIRLGPTYRRLAMIEVEIPGFTAFKFKHLVLDVNGTLAKDGQLLEGVVELLAQLRAKLEIHLVTADTHGTQEILDKALKLTAVRIPVQNQVQAKLEFIRRLGTDSVVAVGNGANDSAMLEYAALGVVIVGPEGAAIESLLKARVVVPNIRAALELLLYPKRLMATLRR
jgi:P-type E1-E2 ATPase